MNLRGNNLNEAIENELELMLAEGYDVSPISAKSLYKRLKCRGHINGSLSTLSTEFRRSIIEEFKKKQLHKAGIKQNSRRALLKGRNTEYYKIRYKEKCEELASSKEQLEKNTAFLVDLILELESTCPTPVEKILTPHLVKAKQKKSKTNLRV